MLTNWEWEVRSALGLSETLVETITAKTLEEAITIWRKDAIEGEFLIEVRLV